MRNISEIVNNLKNGESPINDDLLDYVIGVQLGQIEKYDNKGMNPTLSTQREEAMANLVELIKIRDKYTNR